MAQNILDDVISFVSSAAKNAGNSISSALNDDFQKFSTAYDQAREQANKSVQSFGNSVAQGWQNYADSKRQDWNNTFSADFFKPRPLADSVNPKILNTPYVGAATRFALDFPDMVLQGVYNPLYDTAKNFANVAQNKPMTPYSELTSGAAKLGYDLTGQGGNFLGDIGQTIAPIAGAYTGGKTFGMGKTALAKGLAGEGNSLALNALKQNFKSNFIPGAIYGTAEGLNQGRDQGLGNQLLQAGVSGLTSGAFTGALGAGIPASGALLGKYVINPVAKRLVEKFGMQGYDFLANKDLITKVITGQGTPEEVSQFNLLNQTNLIAPVMKSRVGLQVKGSAPKQGAIWEMLKTLYPRSFDRAGNPKADIVSPTKSPMKDLPGLNESVDMEALNKDFGIKQALQDESGFVKIPGEDNSIGAMQSGSFIDRYNQVSASSQSPTDFINGSNKLTQEVLNSEDIKVIKKYRATLNKDRFNMAGADPIASDFKTQYAYMQNAKGDPVIGPMIESIEQQLAVLDEKINQFQLGNKLDNLSLAEGAKVAEEARGIAKGLEPLAQEAKKYKSAEEALNSPEMKAKWAKINEMQRNSKVTKTSNNLYHTTSTENLESIAKQGLTIGNKPRFEGVSSPNKISFSANEAGASYYGKPGDVMIRTKTSYKPDDLELDLLAGGEGTYTTAKNIPPEALEVKINGKWQPLTQATGGVKLAEEAWKQAEKDAKFYIGENQTTRGTLKIDEIRGVGLKPNETINPNADITKPVVVVKTSVGYQLVDGRNRIEKLKQKGITDVNAIIASKSSPLEGAEEARGIQFVKSNNQYNPLVTTFDANINGQNVAKLGYRKEGNSKIYLANINVNPELRQQGIGTKIIDTLFKENPSVNKIVFQIPEEVPPFWQKIGADFSGTSQEMVLNRKNFYNQAKNLGQSRTLQLPQNILEGQKANPLSNSTTSSPLEGAKVEPTVLEELKYDPSRLEKKIQLPNTVGNPSNKFEVQIRYKGLAADKKAFDTKQEAQRFLDTYEFKGMNPSVAEDYAGTSFDPFPRTSPVALEGGVKVGNLGDLPLEQQKELSALAPEEYASARAKELADQATPLKTTAESSGTPPTEPPTPPAGTTPPPPDDGGIKFTPEVAKELNTDQSVSDYLKELDKNQKAAKDAAKPEASNSYLGELKRLMVDFSAPVSDAMDTAEKTGNYKILPKNDFRLQLDRVLRSTGLAGQFIEDNGLAEVIRQAPDLAKLDQYMIAKQAAKVESYGKETGRNLEMDQKMIQDLAPEYEQYAQKVTQYSQKILDYITEAGLISKEINQALKEKYPDYVPLNRIMDEVEKGNQFTKRSVANLSKQTVVQKLKGSEREIISPLESLVKKTQVAFNQAERNIAAQQLASYKDLPGFEGLLKEIKNGKDAKNKIQFYENGVIKTYETTPEIAAVAKNLNAYQLDIIAKVLNFPVRILKLGATGINPAFTTANLGRDQMTAFVNTDKAAATSLLNPVNFMRALYSALRHDDLYDEMVRNAAGGTTFDILRSSPEATVGKIRAERNIVTNIAYKVTHPAELLRAVENIIGRTEELTRIQQYRGMKNALLAEGRTEQDASLLAAQAARNNTVNFARHGDFGRVLNYVIPYFNAQIQGNRTLIRNFQTKPISTSAKIAIGTFWPVAVATTWNLTDPLRKQAYDDIQDHEKQNNIIVIPDNPTKDEKGQWNVIKIPLSQEVTGLTDIVRKMVGESYGSDPVKFADFAQGLIQAVSPINIGTSTQTVSQLTPQLVKLAVEPVLNKNLYTGKEIVPADMKNLPPEEQVKPYTSATAKEIGKALNISPLKVENEIKTGLGGLGSILINASDNAQKALGYLPSDTKAGGDNIIDAITRRFNKAYGGEVVSKAQAEAFKGLSQQETAAYDLLHTGKTLDENGFPAKNAYQSKAFAALRLANPDVVKSEEKISNAYAQTNGDPSNPFYLLSDPQRQTVLQLQYLPPGSQEKKTITNANLEWLKPYWASQSAYQGYLAAKNPDYKQLPSDKPTTTPELQSKLDAYSQLPLGTGVRTSFLKTNPDVLQFFQDSQAYTNQQRADLGLPLLQTLGSSGFGNRSGGFSSLRFKKPQMKALKLSSKKTTKVASLKPIKPLSIKALKTSRAKLSSAVRIPVFRPPKANFGIKNIMPTRLKGLQGI